MATSFAQIRSALQVSMLGVVLALTACASLPPPTSELAAAREAVARAGNADADQYASSEINAARDALRRAQAAMAAGDEDQARKLALAAAATGDLAHARSRAAQIDSEHARQMAEIATLRQRLEFEGASVAEPLPALPPPPADAQDMDGALVRRLDALDADPQLQGLAAYERLRARQALDTLLQADGNEREDALYLARQRVRIAELSARTEAVRQQTAILERERNQLLVEASRQEAERARMEAERLRIQARIQAEEAARLRMQADEASAAYLEAENVLDDVAGDQAARLRAARERAAELARREAELMGEIETPAEDDAAQEP